MPSESTTQSQRRKDPSCRDAPCSQLHKGDSRSITSPLSNPVLYFPPHIPLSFANVVWQSIRSVTESLVWQKAGAALAVGALQELQNTPALSEPVGVVSRAEVLPPPLLDPPDLRAFLTLQSLAPQSLQIRSVQQGSSCKVTTAVSSPSFPPVQGRQRIGGSAERYESSAASRLGRR